jgi:hypothetical protein
LILSIELLRDRLEGTGLERGDLNDQITILQIRKNADRPRATVCLNRFLGSRQERHRGYFIPPKSVLSRRGDRLEADIVGYCLWFEGFEVN